MKYDTKIKKLPKSEVEMEVSLPADLLAKAREKAIQMFAISMEIPGFRKGHVPENIVIEKAGEGRILEEAADILLKEHFSQIMVELKLDIIGRPQISITKLALGNPMEFKAKFAVLPEFDLPDYKEIATSSKQQVARDGKELEATDKEVEDVLLQIRKNKAHLDYHKANPEDKEHNHPDLENPENLPVLDDEFAKTAGNFKDVAELTEKVKQNIIEEKKLREVEKKRATIMEELLKNTKVELPEILVESETNKALAQMKDDITRMGGKWDEYLVHTKKSEDDLKKDLEVSSEKKAKIQLIFNKIAETEKIKIDETILTNEIKNIIEHYPEASEENARIYVSTMLQNQEVLKLLENSK